jgi:hypothetical protein
MDSEVIPTVTDILRSIHCVKCHEPTNLLDYFSLLRRSVVTKAVMRGFEPPYYSLTRRPTSRCGTSPFVVFGLNLLTTYIVTSEALPDSKSAGRTTGTGRAEHSSYPDPVGAGAGSTGAGFLVSANDTGEKVIMTTARENNANSFFMNAFFYNWIMTLQNGGRVVPLTLPFIDVQCLI